MRDEWQPIETAPKDRKLLLAIKDGLVDCSDWWPGFKMWCGPEPLDFGEPTHWMPLPNPPRSVTVALPEPKKDL